jgi:hypothetical protein
MPLPPRWLVSHAQMRRVIALARERRESFELRYTRLPADAAYGGGGGPAAWRAYEGPVVKLTVIDGSTTKCEVVDQPSAAAAAAAAEDDDWGDAAAAKPAPSACAPDEIALLPPPPQWLTKILLPYPSPLVPSDTLDDCYCTT